MTKNIKLFLELNVILKTRENDLDGLVRDYMITGEYEVYNIHAIYKTKLKVTYKNKKVKSAG